MTKSTSLRLQLVRWLQKGWHDGTIENPAVFVCSRTRVCFGLAGCCQSAEANALGVSST